MLQIPLNLEKTENKRLYRALYEELSAQIRSGKIPEGTRLPGKRTLASELGISVNTVDTAYQMLAAEGYLKSRERSGFTVLPFTDILPETEKETVYSEKNAKDPAEKEEGSTVIFCDLQMTGTDTGLFPFRTWARIQKELLYSSPELLSHGEARGDRNLREALAAYLAAYRGVRCYPEQIVVGAGLEYLLGLLAPLFKGSCGVEDPGYAAARKILENNGLDCISVPVDEGGLSVSELEKTDASLCYVTPSHQYPTGVSMPAGRRAALLRWAAQDPGKRYILEDDYDSEFRFDLKPLPSLQGMAGKDGPVIYLSTVSKSLAPGIRIAYMVLPLRLLKEWNTRYGSYSNTVSRAEQQTFCRFLEEGYFTRHLARMRNTCRGRRDALAKALEKEFSGRNMKLRGLHTGLHFLLTLEDGPSEEEMLKRAGKAGILLTGLSDYYHGKKSPEKSTVIIGYGSLQPEDAPETARILGRVWKD